MEKGPCAEPGFPCLPSALVNRYDQDHGKNHAASVSIMARAIWMKARLIKPSCYLHKANVADSIIIAVLLLLVATAILTAPSSAAEAYQKLQALVLIQGTPEWIVCTGAIGERVQVWP